MFVACFVVAGCRQVTATVAAAAAAARTEFAACLRRGREAHPKVGSIAKLEQSSYGGFRKMDQEISQPGFTGSLVVSIIL